MMTKKVARFFLKSVLFLLLTIASQIGGMIYLITLFINKKWNKQFKGKSVLIFLSTYLLFTFLIVPFIAPIFGRERVKNIPNISPTNYFTIVLNRNYVKPEMNLLLESVADNLSQINPDIEINYLDANFPFIDKFPLLPHLSHNDGKKIDLSFIYETPDEKITNKKKSVSGYGTSKR